MKNAVTVTKVRCSGCERKFSVINIDSQETMECPHCHEKYFRFKGQWQNEKLRETLTRNAQLETIERRDKK